MLLFHSKRMDVYSAPILSASLNALIRLLLQPLRRDSNRRLLNRMSLFAVGQLGFAIWMSLSKNKHELTDIPGDIIFSATGNTSSSVIYYLATLLCALPVTLTVCSTDPTLWHPPGVQQC
jgi:hypothetical protein